MNSEEIIVKVGKVIEERQYGGGSRWLICWHEGQIKCLSADCSKRPEKIFQTFSNYDLILGLTHKQWETLSKKIITFLEAKGK